MRIRPLAALSLAAVAAVLLAGCSTASPSASPTSTAGGDLCSSAVASGAVSDAVTVTGEVGESAAAEFTAPLEVTELERTVAVEGDGTQIGDGDYVSYALAVFDASTGEELQSAGFGDAPLPAMAIGVGTGPDQFFGCATAGSRIVVTVPASSSGAAQVYVIDVLDVTAADAWCAVTEPSGDFATVEFSAEGVPTITIPATDPPEGVQLEVLTEGDGAVVEPGDSVTVNYTGVKWSDGTVFDSSWDRGEPATFETTGVVTGFQRALEGQKVGSTVLVSMAPACGYGEAGSSEHELAGQTLVFVVNIIEAAPAAG